MIRQTRIIFILGLVTAFAYVNGETNITYRGGDDDLLLVFGQGDCPIARTKCNADRDGPKYLRNKGSVDDISRSDFPNLKRILDNPSATLGKPITTANVGTGSVKHEVKYIEEDIQVSTYRLKRILYYKVLLKNVPGHPTGPTQEAKQRIGTADGYPYHTGPRTRSQSGNQPFSSGISCPYDAGHIIPAGIGGPNDKYWNFFPQHSTFNRGAWKSREGRIKSYLQTGKTATQTFVFKYNDYKSKDTGNIVKYGSPSAVYAAVDPAIDGVENGLYDNPDPSDERYNCPPRQRDAVSLPGRNISQYFSEFYRLRLVSATAA